MTVAILGLNPATIGVICALVVSVVYRILQIGKRDPRMPPGPPTIPILGNAHIIPRTGLFKQSVLLSQRLYDSCTSQSPDMRQISRMGQRIRLSILAQIGTGHHGRSLRPKGCP